jgi:uncharacterized repeat protein (TIGR01451 family)
MISIPRMLLTHSWIIVVVALLTGLASLADEPVLGAQATPVIDTVPDLELVETPTNTPFPTPTPEAPALANTPTAEPAGGGGGGSTADSPDSVPTLPPAPQSLPVTGAAPSGFSSALPLTATANLTTNIPLTGLVTATVVDVRRHPSASAGVIDKLFRNETVTILDRTVDGAWWLVCCGSGRGRQGWVSAESIQLGTALRSLAVANQPIPVETTSAIAANGSQLHFAMRPQPAFAWPGRQIELHLVVSNQGVAPAQVIRLRDELPPTLHFLSATVDGDGRLQHQASAAGGTLLVIEWRELAPASQVTAVLSLQVAEDAAPGALIDNLALVSAANAANATAGVTLAMPPLAPPQFRSQ